MTCYFRKEQETEPNRPKRTEPVNSGTGRNRTRNRTEPDRATTRPKNAGRTASNRENSFSEPNQTEPINFRKSPEAKRTEPNRFLPVLCTRHRCQKPSIRYSSRLSIPNDDSVYSGRWKRTVGFHNFNLRIYNLRVSNPNKLIVDVFLTRCRISMCQGLGPKQKQLNFGNRPYDSRV